jgi:Subtilase family
MNPFSKSNLFRFMKKLIAIPFLFLLWTAQAQDQKYWIFLKDKSIENYDYRQFLSPKTIENRLNLNIPLYQETDIPLTADYLQRIEQEGVSLVYTSRWLNAVSAQLDEVQIEKLKKLPFVRFIQPMGKVLQAQSHKAKEWEEYGYALQQMEGEYFAKEQLVGKDVYVGVIDAGFYGSQQDEALSYLFTNEQIIGSRDFVDKKRKDLLDGKGSESEEHGTMVLKMVAGKGGGRQYGFATGAKFFLARSEQGGSEKRVEEDYWVAAMEWMDSVGVRLINTSLGYAVGFDNPDENYKPEQMDGKTSVISKAAQIAVDQKGLLVVVSAGNEGGDDWEIISTPADTKGVMSIGATDMYGLKMYYSSIGAEFLPYLKPNVSCYSTNGTSFSAPIITGFAACLIQQNPKATNKEIAALIEKSGHLYPYGNNYVGYGIPTAQSALILAKGKNLDKSQRKEVTAKETYTLKLKKKKTKELDLAIFHKKNDTLVLQQDYVSVTGKETLIKRFGNAKKTTVAFQGQVIEITWE